MAYLPFYPRFHDLIRSGVKNRTARTKKYGEAGDVVNSPVGPLRIKSVHLESLEAIRDVFWKDEGVESPDEFVKVWCRIHPRAGWTPAKRVWLHHFEPLRDLEAD